MNHAKSVLQFILVMVFFSAIFWGTYQCYIYVRAIFSGLPKEVLAPMIAGSFALIASFITVYVGKYIERKAAIEQEQRQKKSEVYQELIAFILSFTGEEQPTEEEVIAFVKKFTTTILLWGSSEVINEWSHWRKLIINPNTCQTIQQLFSLEKVLLAIRKDMGHKHSGFKQGDFLRLFINDVDSYLK